MKPFDLEKALAGEPVELRDGSKAWVKYVMPDDYKGMYPLRGIRRSVISDTNYADVSWTKEGNVYPSGSPRDLDIIGMWEEPQRQQVTIHTELPIPLTTFQESAWYLSLGKSWFVEENPENTPLREKEVLQQGLYFATREDAQEWLDAMKNAIQ